jgi:hypothetical protein
MLQHTVLKTTLLHPLWRSVNTMIESSHTLPLVHLEINKKQVTYVTYHILDQTVGLLHAVEILSMAFPTKKKNIYKNNY